MCKQPIALGYVALGLTWYASFVDLMSMQVFKTWTTKGIILAAWCFSAGVTFKGNAARLSSNDAGLARAVHLCSKELVAMGV